MKSCANVHEAAEQLRSVAENDLIMGEADLKRRLKPAYLESDQNTEHFRYFEFEGIEVNVAFSIIQFPRGVLYHLLSIYDPHGPLIDAVVGRDIAEVFLGPEAKEESNIPSIKPVRRYVLLK